MISMALVPVLTAGNTTAISAGTHESFEPYNAEKIYEFFKDKLSRLSDDSPKPMVFIRNIDIDLGGDLSDTDDEFGHKAWEPFARIVPKGKGFVGVIYNQRGNVSGNWFESLDDVLRFVLSHFENKQ